MPVKKVHLKPPNGPGVTEYEWGEKVRTTCCPSHVPYDEPERVTTDLARVTCQVCKSKFPSPPSTSEVTVHSSSGGFSAQYSPAVTLAGRLESYEQFFSGRHPTNLMLSTSGQLLGTWRFGNTYSSDSNLYGAYPHSYLERVAALFPDKRAPLHLFSGHAGAGSWLPGDTVDIRPETNPTYLADAQTLDDVPVEDYDLILADPPYSVEDAAHYKTTMVQRNVVIRALAAKARPGTHVVWLDQVLPMYRKADWDVVALIGVVRSTNHRFRVVSIFERRAS